MRSGNLVYPQASSIAVAWFGNFDAFLVLVNLVDFSPQAFFTPKLPLVQLDAQVWNGFWHSGTHKIPHNTLFEMGCSTPGATPQFSGHCWQKPCFQPCHNFLHGIQLAGVRSVGVEWLDSLLLLLTVTISFLQSNCRAVIHRLDSRLTLLFTAIILHVMYPESRSGCSNFV